MKLEKIVVAFSQINPNEEALLLKVLNSIKDFKRKIELIPVFKEIRTIYEEYRKEEQKIKTELLNKYCEEKNKSGDKKIKPEDFKMLPTELISELIERSNKLLETDIKIKKTLKFKEKEIEDSGIDFSEILKLEDFCGFKV